VESAGETLLKVIAKNPGQMYFVSQTGGSSFALVVADLYASKGVRPDRLPELVKQGLAELTTPAPRGLPSDLYPPSSGEDTNREFSQWYGNLTVADIWLKVKDMVRAREALAQVQTLALKSKPKPDVKDATESARQRAQLLPMWSSTSRIRLPLVIGISTALKSAGSSSGGNSISTTVPIT
jgi:hypothetical protein